MATPLSLMNVMLEVTSPGRVPKPLRLHLNVTLGTPLAPGDGFAGLAGYAALALGLAVVLIRRRDA